MFGLVICCITDHSRGVAWPGISDINMRSIAPLSMFIRTLTTALHESCMVQQTRLAKSELDV